MSILENINLKMSVDTKQVNKQFKDATNTVVSGLDAMTLGAEEFEAKWADITDNIRSVKRVASGIAISAAIYGVASALTSASAAVLTFSNNLDEARISMEYFARDSKQAQQYIRELENFAAYTPFSTESAISMAKYLQAMSVPMESSKAVLTVISDTAAATGASEENMQRIVTAMGQVLTKGKLAAEEVRQLANANIPIYDILKEELNLTGQQIKNLGNLNIEGSKAVVAILDGLQKRYEGASAKIAETMGGMVETIKDDALIISSSFFTGAIDGIEEKLRGVRDTLDEWRDIAMHQGTGGMIEYILGDLDPSGELEQLVIDAIAGIKNLSATIRSFAIEDGTLLKTFGATAYASIMSVVVAADYLLRGINTLKSGADKVLSVINDLTGTSLTLTDVAAGLLIFKTVGNTMMFASNTAMWLGKQVITLGTSVASIIPGIAGANALVKGLTASMLSMGAAAAVAYSGIKLMNAITGVSDSSTLVTDEYKEAFKQYDDALNAYSDGLNASYEALSDGAFEAFADIEEQSKKSAKKVQKTWLMSFDEVFQIREDPDAEDSELEDFAAVDWGKYFSLPLFRFPERVAEGVEEAIWKADEAIDAARDSLDGIAGLLPLVIGGLTMLGTSLKNRSAKVAQLQSEGKLRDEDYTYKEQLAKFKDVYKKFAKNDDALLKLTETYKALDNLDEIRRGLDDAKLAIVGQIDDARAAYNAAPTANNKAVIEALEAQQDRIDKLSDFIERQANKRNILAENIEIKQKQTIEELRKLKEQRAKVGSNVEIPTKGIDTAASIVSARKINEQLEDLNRLASTMVIDNAELNGKLRKLNDVYKADELKDIADEIVVLKKKLSTTPRGTEAEGIKEQIKELVLKADKWAEEQTAPISLEINGLQRALSDKLVGIDKGINSAQNNLTKHLQTFGTAAGIDTSVRDMILKNRLQVVVDMQSRTIDAISKAPKEISKSALDSISKDIAATSEAVTKLSAFDISGMSDDLVDVVRINDALTEWVSAQEKYSKILDEQKTLDAAKRAPSRNVGLTYINARETKLANDKLVAGERLDIAMNNIRGVGQAYKELDEVSGLIKIATTEINDISKNVAKDKELLNKVASLTNETASLLRSGTIPATSVQYGLLDTLAEELGNRVDNLVSTNKYKSAMNDTLKVVRDALNGTANTADLDTALKALNDRFNKSVTDLVNGIQKNVQIAVARVSAQVPVYTANALSESAIKLDEVADNVRRIAINTDSYKSTMQLAKKQDWMIDELTAFGSKQGGLVEELTASLISKISAMPDNLYKELNAVIQNPKYAAVIGESGKSAVAQKLMDVIGTVSNPNDADTINNALKNIIFNERAVKVDTTDDALKAPLREYISKISDTVDEATTAIKYALDNYNDLIIKTGVFNDADDVKYIAVAADAIKKWAAAGKDAYELARFDMPGMSAEDVALLERAATPAGPFTGEAPSFEVIKLLEGKIDSLDPVGVQDDVLDSIDEIVQQTEEKIKKLGAEYSDWRLAQNNENIPVLRSIDNSIQQIKDAADAAMNKILYTPEESNEAIRAVKDSVWSLYTKRFNTDTIPGGFYRLTGLTAAEDFNAGRADYAYNYLIDTLNGNQKKVGKAAFRQGFNDYGITRQGNNFYDSLKSIIKDAADEVADTTETAKALGYTKAINMRTRRILEDTLGTIYRGGTGTDAVGKVAATMDGLFTVAGDTYALINRTMVHEQKVLNGLVADLLDNTTDMLTTDTGATIAKVPFSRFAEQFGQVAEDVVSRIGAQMALSKTAGTYVSFTDVDTILSKQPGMKVDLIPPEYKTSTSNIENYVRDATAKYIMRNVDSPITDGVFSENMKGFVIVPDEALDTFKGKLYENAEAIEAGTYIYRTTSAYSVDAANKLLEKTNGLGKAIGDTSARFYSVADVINKLPTVVSTDDTKGFNKYIRELVSKATSRVEQNKATTKLYNVLSDIKNAVENGSAVIENGQNAVVGSKSFTYALEGDNILKQARAEVNAALEMLASKTASTTFSFNDILNAFRNGTIPVANMEEQFNKLIHMAKYLEDTFGMVGHNISTQLLQIQEQNLVTSFRGLNNNPFKILRGQEAVGKMVLDAIEATGDSLDVFIEDAPDNIKKYITESVSAYNEYASSISKTFPTTGVAPVTTLSFPKATADKIEAKMVEAGKLTAEDAKDLARVGKYQTELITDSVRETILDTLEPAAEKGGLAETMADAWSRQLSVTDTIGNNDININIQVADSTITKAADNVADKVSKVASDAVDSIAAPLNEATKAVADTVSYITDLDAPLDAVESLYQFVEKANNENITFTDVDAIEDAIKKQAEKIWGTADYTEMAGKSGLIENTSALERVANNKFVNAVLSDVTVKGISTGFSAFDIADSIRQFFDAMSEGISAYNEATEALVKQTGYNLELPTSEQGTLVSKGEALGSAVTNFVVEGVITGLAINSVGSAVTAAIGATGAAATLASLPIAAAIALVASAAMALTGGYKIQNIAGGSIAETLDNNSWAYDQVYAQTKDEKKAKEAQLKAQRMLYLDYYSKMSPLWAPGPIDDIKNLRENKNIRVNNDDLILSNAEGAIAPEDTNSPRAKAKSAYGDSYSVLYAIKELTGNVEGIEDIVEKNGGLYRRDTGEFVGDKFDAAKLEEFLYAAYTSGAPAAADTYNEGSKWTQIKREIFGIGGDNVVEQYRELMGNIDAITRARLNDMYRLEKDAGDFIASHSEAEVKALLEAYGLAFGDMVTNIEGIIRIYNGTIEYTNSVLAAKAEAINSGTFEQVTPDLLLSNVSGTVNRLLDFDISSVDQGYLDALSDATGIYLQSMSDTMTALTLDIDKVRENITGFTLTMPDEIMVGTEKLSIKALGADASAVDILAGMGVQINSDGTITIDNVAQNVNKSGYTRELAMSGSSISGYEQSMLENIGVTLHDVSINEDDKTTMRLSEEKMLHAIEGLTFTLNGVDATSIPLAVVEQLKAAGINITQNESTGAMSATISDKGFITGGATVADILGGVDTSRISADLRDALESIDALVKYYNGKGESAVSAANGVVLNTGFKSGEYSKALESNLTEAGGTLQEALNANGEKVIYLALNKVSEDWSEAVTAWATSDITPDLKAFLQEIGAEVTTAGEYTIVDTSKVMETLATDNSKYLTELLFDNAELWDSFPEELQNTFIEAGLATKDGFITLSGEVINGWYSINDMLAKSWQALDTATVEAFLQLQGKTLKSWDELTEEQKVKLANIGITTEQQYMENSNNLLARHGESWGLLREDVILGWDELSQTSKDKLAAMGITNQVQYEQYLANMDVATGQGLSAVDATTAAALLAIDATTAAGWAGIKKVTNDELSETQAAALGYMKFEDLPKTIQTALAQGKEGSAYEQLYDGWYSLTTCTETQLGNLNTVASDQLDTMLDTTKSKVAQLRELLSSPEMMAETYMANLSSLASENLKAAKSRNNKYANGGNSFTYDGSWGGYNYDSDAWQNWSNKITIGKQFVAFDKEGGAYYFYDMYLDGDYYGQIAQSAQTGVRKKWLREGGVPEYNEDSEIPAFKLGGLITGDGLFRAGEFGMNEAVLPLEQPAAMARVGQALAASIPAYELVAPLAGALGMRDGGVAQFSRYQKQEPVTQPIEEIINSVLSAQAHRAPQPTSSESSMRPLYVGTLIADKSSLRELNRKMKIVERQDGGR